MTPTQLRTSLFLLCAAALYASGIIPAIIPAAVPTANKQGSTGTKFLIATGSFTAGNVVTTDASGNAIDSGSTGAAAWSSLTSPTGNLSLTMAARSSLFTFNAATGSIDGFKYTDTTNNTGTGILHHSTTASGSSMIPWQADVNGVGWRVTAAGAFANQGSGASGNVALSGSSSGTCNLTVAAAAVGVLPGSAAECNTGSKTVPFKGGFFYYLEGASSQPSVNAASCTGATIGTGATNMAGTVTGLPAGACSVVLTMANSATATTGWTCAVSDQTTANLFRQTASSTTTVTFAGTSLANDVLVYGPCVAY